jgi:hypothetical protein
MITEIYGYSYKITKKVKLTRHAKFKTRNQPANAESRGPGPEFHGRFQRNERKSGIIGSDESAFKTGKL